MKLRKYTCQGTPVYSISTKLPNGNEVMASYFAHKSVYDRQINARAHIAYELRLLREKLRKLAQ